MCYGSQWQRPMAYLPHGRCRKTERRNPTVPFKDTSPSDLQLPSKFHLLKFPSSSNSTKPVTKPWKWTFEDHSRSKLVHDNLSSTSENHKQRGLSTWWDDLNSSVHFTYMKTKSVIPLPLLWITVVFFCWILFRNVAVWKLQAEDDGCHVLRSSLLSKWSILEIYFGCRWYKIH